jgi:hypothetical protein
MRRKKHLEALKYLAVTVIAVAVTAFFFMHRETTHQATADNTPPLLVKRTAEKPQTGYKPEDRQKLEKLIHDGGKDD